MFVSEKSIVLDVVFYQSNLDLLKKLQSNDSLVICPSPQIADNLRTQAPELEILTISKWTTDHLKDLGLVRVRKSELMLKLAAIWRHYFKNESSSLFLQSFELFTELRSITLDLSLLSEFFKELDEDIVRSLLIFWTFIEQEQIIDEHHSYIKISEKNSERSIIFVGFKHLSGIQIDMMKRLGESVDVLVTFPETVFGETLGSDWIRWIHSNEIVKEQKNNQIKELSLVVIPKGKANVITQKFLELNPHYDIVLASSRVDLSHYQEIQKEKAFFKSTEEIFSAEKKWLINYFKNQLLKNPLLDMTEIGSILSELEAESIKKGEYKKLKILQLTKEALGLFSQLRLEVDLFLLEILEIIIGLNSPRVSLVSLKKEIESYLLNVNDLSFKNKNKPIAFLATSSLSGFRSNEKVLSEAMSKALYSIGPLKRAGLEFQLHKADVLAALEERTTVLLIEEQVLEVDLSWREILKSFELSQYDLGMNYAIKNIKEYLKPQMQSGPFLQKRFSASKLQAFIDCPRKYYFSYIEKIENRPMERLSLGADELGQIEHKAIAQYFSQISLSAESVDLVSHKKVCENVFNEYLSEGQLKLNESSRLNSLSEVLHYSLNGIIFLLDLIREKKAQKISFEVSLPKNAWAIEGSVDCLLTGVDSKVSVIDFKRSSGAMGSKADTVNLKKIQLWVYLLVLSSHSYDIDTFAYLNLSDLSDDKLIFRDQEAGLMITNHLNHAQEFIEQTINEINMTVDFIDSPQQVKVCHFCPVKLFCLKGGGPG